MPRSLGTIGGGHNHFPTLAEANLVGTLFTNPRDS